MITSTRFILLVLTFNQFLILFAFAKPLLKKYGNCDPTVDYAFTVSNVSIKTVGDKQYLNITLNFKAPLDNSIRVESSVEMLVGKQYEYLFSINEKKACDSLNKYFGEFVYEIERYAQIIPGICPIPKVQLSIASGHDAHFGWSVARSSLYCAGFAKLIAYILNRSLSELRVMAWNNRKPRD